MKRSTPIRDSLTATSALHGRVRDGLSAVRTAHRSYVHESLRSAFADSLDTDDAFRAGHDTENRWDYLLGHESTRRIVGLEPHTASDKEVSAVIKKRARTLEHLGGHLKPGRRVEAWYWVASGAVDFTMMDKAIIRLANNGITFVGRQLLAKILDGPAGLPRRPRNRRSRW
jgi:hypothetical protein